MAASDLIVHTRTSAPEQNKQHKYGWGHWLLVVDSSETGSGKYSPDGDFWYVIDNFTERIFLYNADLHLDIDSTYLKVYEIAVNSFAGVSGGVLSRKAKTFHIPENNFK